MFMTYSKKLNDLLAYYALILDDTYFTYSTDWSKNLEGCQWLENNHLDFQGKKFKLEDYVQKTPIYNENYELTGEYQKTITPDLPILVIRENYLDSQISIDLPSGIISTLIRSTLSRLAKTEVIDHISVYSKEVVQYNQMLNDFMYKYAKETNPITVPFGVGEDGIYTLPYAYIAEERSALEKERPIPTESLLKEETVIKHNLIGLLSSIAEFMGEEQLHLVPKKPIDIN